nr:immunoglobulin heavy chain junction region [Mus musculus]
CARGNDAMDYW